MDTVGEKIPSIAEQLQKHADEDPDKTAFIFWDKNHKRSVFTRREVLDRSKQCAAVFKRMGVKKGDIVCNTLVNSRERIITTYGTILVGAVSMHGQKFLADGEDIMKNLRDSKCRFIIVDPNETKGVTSILEGIKSKDNDTGEVMYKGLPFLTTVIQVVLGDGPDSWLQQLNNETDSYIEENISPDDIVYICATSGSTGFAKLVPHTTRSLYPLGVRYDPLYVTGPNDVLFNPCSLGWIGGCPIGYVFLGITRIIIDQGNGAPENRAATVLHILEHDICDSMVLLPSDLQSLLDVLDEKGQHAINPLLKIITTGGASITKATLIALGRVTEKTIVVYGSTEADLTFALFVDDPESYESACVGYPTQGVKIKILDENLKEVSPGTLGNIYLQSPTCAKHYVNNPEGTRETFLEDGWLCTSDIGYLNVKGQLFVYGRKSNIINHKGFIHHPGWMEARIDKHPSILGSVVFGIPDPVNHEELCVCVIEKPQSNLDSHQIRDICRTLFLTAEDELITPIPKYCLLFDTFPMNANAKVDRKQLKELAMKRIIDRK